MILKVPLHLHSTIPLYLPKYQLSCKDLIFDSEELKINWFNILPLSSSYFTYKLLALVLEAVYNVSECDMISIQTWLETKSIVY